MKIKSILGFLSIILASLVIFAVIFLSINWLDISYHEYIHQDIFNDYHCDSIITYDFLRLGGKTMPNNCTFSDEDYRAMTISHDFNDIIGYASVGFEIMFSILITLAIFILIYLIISTNLLSEIFKMEKQLT